MTEPSRKRKAEESGNASSKKKSKGPKQWQVPKKNENNQSRAPSTIEPGDSGIWATCNMRMERKCINELRDLLSQYVNGMNTGLHDGLGGEADEDSSVGLDIEANIKEEIEAMQTSHKKALFQTINIDIKCVTFIKTQTPIDPVSLVHRICKDAQQSSRKQKSRWIRRLTPMTLMGKATEKGLEEVARAVLAPHFHQEGNVSYKFAIRTSIRNHTVLTRDVIIKQVADMVGNPHTVDLEHYDRMILVDFYKNLCGMSVIGNDFETLRRYNLAEIYNPTVKPPLQINST